MIRVQYFLLQLLQTIITMDWIETAKACPVLKGLETKDLLQVLQKVNYQLKSYKADDIIAFQGDEVDNYANNSFILSGWMDKEKMSIGATVEFSLMSLKEETMVTGDSMITTDPSNPALDYTSATILDSSWIPSSGMGVDVELKSFYNYNDYAQGRFYLGFFMDMLSYHDDAFFLTEGQTRLDINRNRGKNSLQARPVSPGVMCGLLSQSSVS